MTIDWQRLPDGTQLCQWLWGRPVTAEIEQLPHSGLLKLAEEVVQTAHALNIRQVDPLSVGLNLPNEMAVLDTCPFRPDDCVGKHVVASGAGIIPN